MRIGDLVELSNAGKKLKMMRPYLNDIGVINKMEWSRYTDHRYTVYWSRCGLTSRSMYFVRKDLKHARRRN